MALETPRSPRLRTLRRARTSFVVACFFALGVTACGSPSGPSTFGSGFASSPDDPDHDAPAFLTGRGRAVGSLETTPWALSGAAIPRPIHRAAAEHLARVRGSAMAPGWSHHASLVEDVRPVYRPDLEKPAYYEFAVDEGGFMVVSTGDHDVLIPHFSDTGLRPTELLLRQAKRIPATPKRFYRLDSLTWVGEDAGETLVARLGADVLVPPPACHRLGQPCDASQAKTEPRPQNWLELKRTYKDTFAIQLDDLRDRARAASRGSLETGSPDLQVPNPIWAPASKVLRVAIDYWQFRYKGCPVGCGAVAWGQFTAYADYMAHHETNTPLGSWYANALHADRLLQWPAGNYVGFPEPAKDLIRELRNALGTFCIGDQGATLPTDMSDYDAWARAQGAHLRVEDDSFWDQEDKAGKWLRAQRAVVLGVGFYLHYVLAYAYGRIGNTRYVYANFGWQGRSGDGWIPLRCFYAGTMAE